MTYVASDASIPNDVELAVRLRRRVQNAARIARILVTGTYIAAIAYLCAVAVAPTIREAAPTWWRWFGSPGSWVTLAVVLAIPLAFIPLARVSARKPFWGNPLIVVAAMAASATVLGFTSYLNCHSDQSPVFAPLSWTLALFVGNVEDRYGQCATQPFPVALELARLLAIATTLTTAVAAARTLFRAQFDRIAIWRARSLTVVVGVDEDSMSMVHAVAQRMGHRQTLVIVTGAANRNCVSEARSMGARVREVASLDYDVLAQLGLWRHLDRLYLLSEDPVRNETRLRAIDAAMDRLGVDKPRLPLTVRIDDPWQAENWRRSFLDTSGEHGSTTGRSSRWVADAIGRAENTAAIVVRHVIRTRPHEQDCDTVLICGLVPLTYALMSELAQVHREQSVYYNPRRRLPTRVVVMATGASGFLTDHRIRQERIAPGESGLEIDVEDIDPTVDSISTFVTAHAGQCSVILTEPSMESIDTRLSNRLPKLRIYVASPSTGFLPETSIVSSIFPFPITLEFEPRAPQDAWERAAELIHEAYRANAKREGWDIAKAVDKDWADLDPFWQQSNRRQVTHTLALVESVGHTWNTLDHPPAPPLPDNFADLDRATKLRSLGFTDIGDVKTMIREEHEDWREFYEQEGWEAAPQRNDDKKRHNRLHSWDTLLEQDEKLRAEITDCTGKGVEPPKGTFHEDRAMDSLIDVVHTLRSLGYRSIPKYQWRRFTRRGIVTAHRRDQPWSWTTKSGDVMHGEAGHWSVTDEHGGQRSVSPAAFAASYVAIDGDRYQRTGVFLARQVLEEEVVVTDEGTALAKVGDWILQGSQGEVWPVPAAAFAETYEGPLPED
ncbi:hypothetical protein ACPCIR_05795 [Mycobacterium sp. NPDC051198]